ncbi:MAG: C15orf41 family protein [Methanomassiliicoccaceae archaeon]|nr:C15orf41 family protein [Methanomassiliicoccaceae archaeon]
MEKKGYDSELLITIFTQRTTREVKKRFYVVKQNSGRMLREWKQGHTLLEISNKWRFPPILTAMFIFLEDGASRKEFWEYINEPDIARNKDLRNEIMEIRNADLVYSPEANERQRQRGIWGESLLHEWLDGQGITYRTEPDLRGVYEKTPDALLDTPMTYNGKKIYWVESKASFGDNTEFRMNSKKQLIPYTKIFGPGVVVYWLGCLDDLEEPEGVYVDDISIMQKRLGEFRE